MALFEWEDVYSVGNDAMDAQHQELFDIANRFYAAFNAGASRTALASIFNEMLKHTAEHFADEEQLMREAGYPGLAAHKLTHEKLVGLVSYYQAQFGTEAPDVEQRAMGFIKTWLTGHILGSDRDYGAFIAKRAA